MVLLWRGLERMILQHLLKGDTYYYGCDELFARHPDIVKRLIADARRRRDVAGWGLVSPSESSGVPIFKF